MRELHSPADLMKLAGVAPPSFAIEAILDAAYAATPTLEQHAQWKALSRMPWPKVRPRTLVGCIGRRGLKTSGIGAWVVVYESLVGGHEQHALAGSRIYANIICPKIAQAREAMVSVRAVLDSLARLGVRYVERDAAGAPEIVITSPEARCERVIAAQAFDDNAGRSRAIHTSWFDEGGHLPSESWLSTRDADVARIVRAAQLQFPRAIELWTSNPGKPQSAFHDLVEKPKRGTLVVRAPTWVTNPRITREKCVAEAKGDDVVFQQEFEASRFGYGGDNYFDSARVWACLGSEHAGKGPRRGSFLLGFDHGQLSDDAAIVVASSFEVQINPGHAPVRHVVVEESTSIPSSHRNPQPTAALVGRIVAFSESYGDAPVLFDQHCAVDVKNELKKRGYREHEDEDRVPPRRTFMQLSMAPQHQTPRWRGLRDLAHGARLHLRKGDDSLAAELCGLTATEQSSGTLKVEGRKDNQADALALCVPYALRMATTGGPAGTPELLTDGVSWAPGEGPRFRNPRWVSRLPNGRAVPAEWPRWHPGFAQYAREMISNGVWTDAIRAWHDEQKGQ